MCGDKISCGRGEINNVGNRSWRTRIAAVVSVTGAGGMMHVERHTVPQFNVALGQALPLSLIELRIRAWR